ncbi:MAG: sugar transferase, partial [Spirochaetota bacterium]
LLIVFERKIISLMFKKEYSKKNIVFLGRTKIAYSLITEIENNDYLKKIYNIVGILSLNRNLKRKENNELNKNQTHNDNSFYNYPLLGTKDNLKEVIEKYDIDEILMASEENWQDKILNSLIESNSSNKTLQKIPDIKVIPSPYEIKIGKLKFSKIHDFPIFDIKKQLSSTHHLLFKRIFDIVMSIILLTIASPLILVTSLIIKLNSHGPVFYYQKRVGRNKKRFTIIKFRTMYNKAEKNSGMILSPQNDKRVTPIGKFLRLTRIDELPQLINVIKGDMSFVGPRPERAVFVRKYIKEIDAYSERFKVKPGLTGFAQIQGDYHTKPEVKIKYDLAYIYNWSVWLEIRILLETVKVVLTRKGH